MKEIVEKFISEAKLQFETSEEILFLIPLNAPSKSCIELIQSLETQKNELNIKHFIFSVGRAEERIKINSIKKEYAIDEEKDEYLFQHQMEREQKESLRTEVISKC